MKKKRRAIALDELTWSELAQNHPELLRHKLENGLTKPVSVEQLAGEITRIVKALGRKPGSPETVARYIATALAPHLGRSAGRCSESSQTVRSNLLRLSRPASLTTYGSLEK